MGRFGRSVIDADGHGGEPLDWRRRIQKRFEPQMREYVAAMKARYQSLPGGGMQINERNPRELDRPQDDPCFDVVWQTAERLDVAVCTHGGGQAPGQTPFGIERFDTRLGVHAITHPIGAMQAVYCFTIGGILHRFPKLRVGFLEAGVGWLPFWLERLDEHYQRMPEQAPELDRPPSEYFVGHCYVTTEPEEKMVPYVFSAVSSGVVCYTSDYCHWDCAFPDSVRILEDRTDIQEGIRDALFASNAARLYGLPLPGAGETR